MNSRIEYLKTITKRDSADIQAFRELSEKEYYALSMEELARKAHFLTCFAREIPLSMDKQERLVGSMRFMDRRQGIANRNKGHIIVDYRMILREGIGGIRRRIAALKTPAAEAMEKSMAALVLFMRRHAEAAEAMDMTDVAENCRFLTENAPQNFHQALQLIWFVHLFLHAEGVCAAVSFGRFDDYMYPFYRRDMETGALTREEAKELLMCFWLKTCEGDESQNLTVGGDVENELTYLCMEVTRELKVRQPSVSVRICENTTQRLWNETLQLIKAGIGMPAIFNDAVVIRSLENAKVEPEDAKNYAIVGCYEANSDGNTFGTTACAGLFYLSDVLLEFLKKEEDYADYPAFLQGFKAFF
ncbi:MAG: pyruvate formate lyase family protein, partial [Clostridia bacterium]|nr:pyruvate formate lyase family protein [Clostridia bacterium]